MKKIVKERNDKNSERQLYYQFGLIIVSIIALSIIWEFCLEPILPLDLFGTGVEKSEEKWEYITTVTVFSLMAMIAPFILLKRNFSILKSAEQRFRELTENIPEVFWIASPDSNQVIYVSPAYAIIWGRTCKNLYDNPKSWVDSIHPDDRERITTLLDKHIKGEVNFVGEYRIIRPDGTIRWILDRAFTIKDNLGETIRIVGTAQDITKQKNLEEKLKLLNESLEQRMAERSADLAKANEELLKMQKLESIGILAGGIAHDFNNYLQGILTNNNLALANTNPKEEIHDYLIRTRNAIRQAKGLSQQLLTFAKGGEPVKETIYVSELIKDSSKLATSGSNVRCELDLPDCLCLVEVDKGQMHQVFCNMFINADQAMPNGGIIKVKAEEINVEAKDTLPLQEGSFIKISLEDQGIGIQKENLQKIFDPYFTTKKKGNGLGLSVVYSIIKKHGGYVCAESEVGVGTTFYIYLPASENEVSRKTASGETKRKSEEGTTSLRGGKILLMDDDGIIRISTTHELRNLEYEVEQARNGTEAIELYKKARESGKPFDAVILDLTIPGSMGGIETIKKLLRIEPDVKAIVASGYSDDPVVSDFKRYGFKGFVAKPYETYELNEALREVILQD